MIPLILIQLLWLFEHSLRIDSLERAYQHISPHNIERNQKTKIIGWVQIPCHTAALSEPQPTLLVAGLTGLPHCHHILYL